MVELQKNRGTILLDNEDYKRVIDYGGWYIHREGYVLSDKVIDGKRKGIKLHRFIANTPDGLETDHKNGNKLDNRRENLRICTKSENLRNQGLSKNNTSGFKGVSRNNGRWLASITVNRKYFNLGRFKTREEAAIAYNQAAIKYHGEFAKLNIIKGE